MSFAESNIRETAEGREHLEQSGEFFMDDKMDALPTEVEVETLADVINDTGLSPDALEQYRVSQSAE